MSNDLDSRFRDHESRLRTVEKTANEADQIHSTLRESDVRNEDLSRAILEEIKHLSAQIQSVVVNQTENRAEMRAVITQHASEIQALSTQIRSVRDSDLRALEDKVNRLGIKFAKVAGGVAAIAVLLTPVWEHLVKSLFK